MSAASPALVDDEAVIRRMIENWAVWRDTGDWERFATLWADDGVMSATWFEGSAGDFIAAGRRAWGSPARAHHIMGGSAVAIAGARAVATTRMTLLLRSEVEGELCDVTVTGLFLDLFARRMGDWRLVRRQPVYEKDRIDPVRPGAALSLDTRLLSAFPSGYRHLAYAQTRSGMTVNPNLPAAGGASIERLQERAGQWLASDKPWSLIAREPEYGESDD